MKTFKRWIFLLAAMFVGMFYGIAVHAEEAIDQIVAPTGFKAILVLVPLVLVLVLLFRKVDMIIAGLVAGILAMIIGGISLAEANTQLLEAVPTMLSITVPIINSAVAMAVFKAGSYTAALTLAKRGTKRQGRICFCIYCHFACSSYLYVWYWRRQCHGDRTTGLCSSGSGSRIDCSHVASGSCFIYNFSCLLRIKYCFQTGRL